MDRTSIEQEPFISKDAYNLEETGDDSPKHVRKPTLRPTPLIIAIILTAVASSMLTLILQSLYIAFLKSSPGSQDYTLPDLTLSNLGPVSKIFSDEKIYLNRTTAEEIKASDEAWLKLIPNGRGFVSLSKLIESSEYGIPPSLARMDKSHKGEFAVSSFHQLHCLHMVVKSYFSALGSHDHDVVHTKHCLEYLRNSIICSADSALEPWKKDLHGVDGFGNPHMCRDFEGLFQWAEKYRASDV
ncbi:hypothetical protein H072_8989 [Dactylellina haptotyla CBS 200.50]|uniref:Uncharacterized protein n=1 Tax=Dactylellina haptotyla (strain CBS 200.50) TaxID=1284197 RepID=S8BDR5_DACHA|nr:hypothetical protein H072_8989 [Dactylellina haptotyla CBS 200.50]